MNDVTIADVVTRLEAGVSPACDAAQPECGEFGVLTLAAVTSGLVGRTNAKRISKVKVKATWPVLKKGTVLVTRASGSKDLVGACVLVSASDDHLILPDKIWALELAPGRSHRLLVEFLKSARGRRSIHSICRGSSGMWNIPQDRFLAIRYPTPSERLEAAFDRAVELLDKITEGLAALCAAKRTFKRGLLQQLLTGQKRFSEFRNGAWKSSRLGDHVAMVNRKNEHGLKLVLTASGEHGLVDQRTYFNRNVSGFDLSKYFHLKKGEFAYNRSAMKGYPFGATKRLDGCEEGVLSVLYLCFAISDSNLDSDFLKHVFDSGVLNRQLRPIVRVGARAHGLLNVTDQDYLSINIPFPGFNEQQRIAAFLTSLTREIDLLAAQRQQIERYKRGLLSHLLSGELKGPA